MLMCCPSCSETFKWPLSEYIIRLNYTCTYRNYVIRVAFKTTLCFVSLQSDRPRGKCIPHANLLSWWGRIQPDKVKGSGHKGCKRGNLTKCLQIFENVVISQFSVIRLYNTKTLSHLFGGLYNLLISQNESAGAGRLNEWWGSLGQFRLLPVCS